MAELTKKKRKYPVDVWIPVCVTVVLSFHLCMNEPIRLHHVVTSIIASRSEEKETGCTSMIKFIFYPVDGWKVI